MAAKTIASIVESHFEYRADFTAPMFGVWTIPNPQVSSLFSALRKWDVGLEHITWNKDATTYKDIQITCTVSKLNAFIRIGLDAATFTAVNPDWSSAQSIIELFETAMRTIQDTAKVEILVQEIALAMHVKPGEKPYRELMSVLVNANALGPGQMYGVSVYREDSSLVIDRSVRYADSVFIRLQRELGPSVPFAEIAKILYEDESKALRLLGLEELLQG